MDNRELEIGCNKILNVLYHNLLHVSWLQLQGKFGNFEHGFVNL